MVTGARGQPREARFRTELTPKFGTWLVVAIVYGLWATVLFLLFRFLSSFQQYASFAQTLVSAPLAPDAGALAAELRMEVLAEAALLGAMVLLSVTLGGALFLSRSRYLERLLASRAAEIEEIDRSRRLFFATASHELRTPVTAIMGEAEVALFDEEHDPPAMLQALDHIIAHARFLGHRIEEMIGLAQTSDGKLHLDSEALDFREVVNEAAEDARWFAASVEVSLDVKLPARAVHVVGDRLWLKRALLAVIENALKFSPMKGKVTIEMIEQESNVEVVVTDEGPGIVPDELPLIFEAYYQTATGRERGGSGLGLAMTRWVAEQHGGKAYARNLPHHRRRAGCAVTIIISRERNA
jgi:signal transduction histidine kinase